MDLQAIFPRMGGMFRAKLREPAIHFQVLPGLVFVATAVFFESMLFNWAHEGLGPDSARWQLELAGWLELARLGERSLLTGALFAAWWFVAVREGGRTNIAFRVSRNAIEELAGLLLIMLGVLFSPLRLLLGWLWGSLGRLFCTLGAARRRERWRRIATRRKMMPLEPGALAATHPQAAGVTAKFETWLLPLLVMPLRVALYALSAASLAAGAAWRSLPLRCAMATLVFPVRFFFWLRRLALTLFRVFKGLSASRPFRRCMAGLVLAWLAAASVALLLQPLPSYSLHSPTVTRLILKRTSAGSLPEVSTAALERSQKMKLSAAGVAILEAGGIDGVFVLTGYQEALRREGKCRDALPQLAGLRFSLQESVDSAALMRAGACENRGASLPVALYIEAFLREPRARIGIHEAIATGSADLVRAALDHGASVDEADGLGRSPIMAALDGRAAANDKSRHARQFGLDEESREAVFMQLNSMAIVFGLSSRGASYEAIDHAGRSVAFAALAAGERPPEKYLMPGFRSAMGATLLHAAAASGEVELAKLLVSRGVTPSEKTADNRTPMHFARDRKMVRYLLSLGLSPNAKDSRGRTPFHAAVMAGDIEAARIFKELSYDPEAPDLFGKAALDYAPRKPLQEALKGAADDDKSKADEKQKKRPEPEWQQWQRLRNQESSRSWQGVAQVPSALASVQGVDR